MQTLVQDFRYALRLLKRSPGFAAAAVMCLALGIGATTAIFSVVNAVILRPLPYAAPEQLVRIYTEFPTFPNGGLRRFWVSPPEYVDLKRDLKSWESIGGWTNSGVNFSGGNEPIRVTASNVTGGLLTSLGVAPLLGRLPTAADDVDGAPLVAVISSGLWQRAFGGERSIIGKNVQVNGRGCTVVGVMPGGFQFPPGEVDAPEVWIPLQLNPSQSGRGSHFLSLLGRLKHGVSYEQARGELNRLVQQQGLLASPNNHMFHPERHPIVAYGLHDEVVGGVRPAMMMLLAAVGFVLLISCVNVANLLLARAESRQREIAVRTAIGAGYGRLVRQFVTEGLVLSLLGAFLGLLFAFAGLRLIAVSGADSIPRSGEIGVDGRVLLFTIVISMATGLFFGLAPLAQVATRNLHGALKAAAGRTTGSAGSQRFRGLLVIAELSLALVLLIGTGLMIRAFWKLQEVQVGISPQNVITMRVSLPSALYQDGRSLQAFWTNVQQRVSQLPGVTSATMMTGMPPVRPLNANDTSIEGFVPVPGGPMQNVDYYQLAGKNFFETLGIRLLDGRFLDERDGGEAPPVVVVNQTMARTFWAGQNPLGRRIKPGGEKEWRTVVGVVADVKNAGIDKPTGTEIFIPYLQSGSSGALRNATVVLRATQNPTRLVAAARSEIQSVDAALPISNIRTMEEVLQAARSRPRFLTLLLSLFSGVALALATLGIYGVISYSVARRTTEFGIRMAMGARPADVIGMVVGQGLRLGLIGVAAGAIGAFVLTRYISGLLFGVEAFDPATFGVMAVLLAAVTALACYIPARRATKVDPMVALRYE
ncbi:MAG: ABC transporter permease [Bryobacteraceae bacterium]